MARYRVLKNLTTGHKRGEIIEASELASSSIAPLVKKRAIAEIGYPPLSALPGWTLRAERMAQLGIADVGAFLDADKTELAAALGIQPRTMSKWCAEAAEAVNVPGATGCRGCKETKRG